MRWALALMAIAVLAACSRPADVTARYSLFGLRELVVRAAANGDARVDADGIVFIRNAGQDYVVTSDDKGSFAARRQDLLAVIEEIDSPHYREFWPGPDYAVKRGPAETVAGIGGRVTRLYPSHKDFAVTEVLVTDDPAYAKLGRALAIEEEFKMAGDRAHLGRTPFEAAMLQLYRSGAVLRIGDSLRLERVEKGPIDLSLFAVPRPVLGRAALRERFRRPEWVRPRSLGSPPPPDAPGRSYI